jgi:hypothetical protein
VSEKSALGRIVELMRERRRRRLTKFCKEKLRDFHYSPGKIRVIKPVMAGLVGHSASLS